MYIRNKTTYRSWDFSIIFNVLSRIFLNKKMLATIYVVYMNQQCRITHDRELVIVGWGMFGP